VITLRFDNDNSTHYRDREPDRPSSTAERAHFLARDDSIYMYRQCIH